MSTKLGTILADFTTSLATDLAIGGTSATLSSATDDDGVALPSGRYFFTLDGTNSSKEHISCDLVGTSISNIKSLSRQGVETTGVARKHRIGTTVSLTDFGHIKFINDLIAGTTTLNASAPLGYDGAPASLTGNQLATVTYVLGVVNGGTVYFDQQVISAQTSGEALAINDIVYFKESDQRWYKVDANLTTTFDLLQLGVCKTTAAGAAVTIQVAISGPVSGFSGLTAGSKYYVSNTAGSITTTPGTYSVFVGWALSTTILLFDPVLKTLPTQKEKDALAGTVGIPASTNKFVTADNVSGSSTDQTQTTQNSSVETGEADTTTKKNKIAQSFIPSRTKIRGVYLNKQADTGTFTGSVTVELQADNSGSPSGTPLATVTITNTEYEALSTGEFLATFTSEYASLTVGSLYWIVVYSSTSDSSNHPNLGINTAGGYSSGSVKYYNATDTWVAISTIDLYFKTLEGNASQLPKTNSSGKIESDFYDITEMPTPAFFQQIPTNNNSDANGVCIRSTSNQDGSVLIIVDNSGASGSNVVRLARDTKTGQYFVTHSASPTGSSTGKLGIVILGNYLYIFYDNGATMASRRVDLADLSNETAMTIGIAITTSGAAPVNVNAFTDGKYIYVQEDGGTTFHKLSVSGTIFTQVSTLTVDTAIDNNDTSFFFDGKHVVACYCVSASLASGNYSLFKFTDPTAAPTVTTFGLGPFSRDRLATAGQRAPVVANIDSNRLYVGQAYGVGSTVGGTDYNSAMITLIPITKPS